MLISAQDKEAHTKRCALMVSGAAALPSCQKQSSPQALLAAAFHQRMWHGFFHAVK